MTHNGRYIRTVFYLWAAFVLGALAMGVYTRIYTNEDWVCDCADTIIYTYELSNDKLDINISTDLLVAEGDCVEKAVAITYILYREGMLDDKVYAAASDNHVQMVRVDGEITYYDELFWNVVKGSNEFDEGLEVEFYDPFLFAAAALEFHPHMTKDDLDQYALSLGQGATALEDIK